MTALLLRDLAAWRADTTGALVGLMFLLTVVGVVTFGVGADLAVLRRIGPGVLWAGALLSGLLGMERLLRPDLEDGTLDLLATADIAWEAVAGMKAVSHWLTHLVPLVLAAPVLALLFGRTPGEAAIAALTLLVGTPVISLAGTLGAALGLLSGRSGLLTAVVAVPFTLPTLIFGASAALAYGTPDFLTPFLLLCASTLFAAVLMPIATGAVLRGVLDG